MKIKNLIAVAALLLGSANTFAAMNLNDKVITKDGISYEIQSVYKNPTTGQENIAWVAESNAYTGATLNIPATVTLSVKGTDSQTGTGELIEGEYVFKVQKIKPNAFKGNTKITTVTIGENLDEIGASAFNECTKITSVTFAAGSKLATLGNFVFGNTPSLTALDFTNCESLATIATTPFLPSAGNPNNYLTSLTFSKVGNVGYALANLPKLSTLALGTGAVVLAGGSLAGDDALTTLTIPGGTTVSGAPFTSNDKLTSLIVSGDFTGSIAANAFAGQNKLATVTFADVDGGTLGATAIGSAVTTLTFGELKDASNIASGAIVLANNAATVSFTKISDCPANAGIITGTASKTVTLGLGIIADDIDAVIVSNANLTVTTGVVSKDIDTDAFPTATSITFGNLLTGGSISGGTTGSSKLTSVTFGDIADAGAITAGAFAKFDKLATVSFSGTLVSGAVALGSFGDGSNRAGNSNTADADGYKLIVTWEPTTYVDAFDSKAFADKDYDMIVKLVTTRAFACDPKYATDYPTSGTITTGIANVKLSFPVETKTITVTAKEGSTSFYAKFVAEGSNFEIAKTNDNGDKVVVYEAYPDSKEGAIYMLPLTLSDGKYIVKAGEAVIVRAWGNADLTASATTTPDTHNYSVVPAAKNKLTYYNKGVSYDYLTVSVDANKVLDANPGKFVWAVANFEKYNLDFKKFDASITLPAYTVYIVTDKDPTAAGGRLNIVWLDGSEDETTAIQKVQTEVVEDGAIYNLQGVRVNAAYKGVVIKNGKKMIQK